VLGNGCDNARNVDRKALESRVLTGLREHDDAGDRRRGHAHLDAGNQSAQPPAPKLIGIHPPKLA
jgi:hypothetical protein